MTGVRILLDEHVGRVFERVLRERGYDVEQAKDLFGEFTDESKLLEWCGKNGAVLYWSTEQLIEFVPPRLDEYLSGLLSTSILSNNAKDFEPHHTNYDHAGILLYYDQKRPDTDPEGLARTVDEVFNQYGPE